MSHDLVPPFGWNFLDGEIKFSSETFDELVKKVLEYRKSNNLPIGNPIEEIEDQILEKYPGYEITGFKFKIHGR